MDEIDVKIIKALADDADKNASELVSIVNLSVPAINKRISRLKSDGTIKKTTIVTDGKLTGKPVIAFVLITVESFEKSEALIEELKGKQDILELYAVSGEYDYILKLCARDVDELEEKLLRIKSAGAAKSLTMMCLREYKSEAALLPD
ncbi:MAG: Lrp/AsnC family transcriptional regulator [Lachnospiraceae bacterium]|nr:Lrp/AsnC family transcriptional regulator [Lachnospiraceae bacterium]